MEPVYQGVENIEEELRFEQERIKFAEESRLSKRKYMLRLLTSKMTTGVEVLDIVKSLLIDNNITPLKGHGESYSREALDYYFGSCVHVLHLSHEGGSGILGGLEPFKRILTGSQKEEVNLMFNKRRSIEQANNFRLSAFSLSCLSVRENITNGLKDCFIKSSEHLVCPEEIYKKPRSKRFYENKSKPKTVSPLIASLVKKVK